MNVMKAILIATLFCCVSVTAQNSEEKENMAEQIDLFIYHLRLEKKYRSPKNWSGETRATIKSHAKFLDELGRKGILIFAGRTLMQPESDDLFGIAVIKAKDLEQAREYVRNDPAVVAGIQSAKILPFSIGIQYFKNLEDK